MDLSRESQTSTNTCDWNISRGEKLISVEGSSSRKLDFPNICNLFHQFSKYIWRLFAGQCYDSFLCFSPLLFMFLWILFLTKDVSRSVWFHSWLCLFNQRQILILLRAVIKRWGWGISPSYYECAPQLLSKKNSRKIEPKETQGVK